MEFTPTTRLDITQSESDLLSAEDSISYEDLMTDMEPSICSGFDSDSAASISTSSLDTNSQAPTWKSSSDSYATAMSSIVETSKSQSMESLVSGYSLSSEYNKMCQDSNQSPSAGKMTSSKETLSSDPRTPEYQSTEKRIIDEFVMTSKDFGQGKLKIFSQFLQQRIPCLFGFKDTRKTIVHTLIPSFVDNVRSQKVAEPELHLKDKGNGAYLNFNLKDFVVVCGESAKPDPTIFEAVSIYFFDTDDAAPLFRLSTALCMVQQNGFAKMCELAQISTVHAIRNVVDASQALHPLSLVYLSEVLKRPIVLHFGHKGGCATSYKYGNFGNEKSIHFVESDQEILPVFPFRKTVSQINFPHKLIMGFPYPKISTSAMPELSKEFQTIGTTFHSTCGFCKMLHVPSCHHLLAEHYNALASLQKTFQQTKFGQMSKKDIPTALVDTITTQNLPSFLKDKFTVVKTPGDGNCLYSSVSFSMTGNFDLQYSLRRSVAAEYRSNKEVYKNIFSRILLPEDIPRTERKIYSTTEWGNSETLLILSKITCRKISVFSLPGHGANVKGFVHYDFNADELKPYPPIFILCRGNLHFDAMVPNSMDDIPTTDNVGISYLPLSKAVVKQKHSKEVDDNAIVFEIEEEISTSSNKLENQNILTEENRESSLELVSRKETTKNDSTLELSPGSNLDVDLEGEGSLTELQNASVTSKRLRTSDEVGGKEPKPSESNLGGKIVKSFASAFKKILHNSPKNEGHAEGTTENLKSLSGDARNKKNYFVTANLGPMERKTLLVGDYENDLVTMLNLESFAALDNPSYRDSRNLFLNILKDNVPEFKELNGKNHILKFVHLSQAPSFWKKTINGVKNPTRQYMNRKINHLRTFQEKKCNTEMAANALKIMGVSKENADYYEECTNIIHGEKYLKRNKGRLKENFDILRTSNVPTVTNNPETPPADLDKKVEANSEPMDVGQSHGIYGPSNH